MGGALEENGGVEVCGLGDWGLGDGGRVCRSVCVVRNDVSVM